MPKSDKSSLQLKWDLSNQLDNLDATRLLSHWKEMLRKGDKSPLMPVEREVLGEIEDTPDVHAELVNMFEKDPKLYIKVRTEIQWLMMAWEIIWHEKRRFDKMGDKTAFTFQGGKHMSDEACLAALKIIPRRTLIGLPTFGGGTKGKRKLEQIDDDPVKMRKVRFEEGSGEGSGSDDDKASGSKKSSKVKVEKLSDDEEPKRKRTRTRVKVEDSSDDSGPEDQQKKRKVLKGSRLELNNGGVNDKKGGIRKLLGK